jgi:hypothetical protein
MQDKLLQHRNKQNVSHEKLVNNKNDLIKIELQMNNSLDLFPDTFDKKTLKPNYIEVSENSPFSCEKLLQKDWKQGVAKVLTYPLTHIKQTKISDEKSMFFDVEGVDGKRYTFSKVNFNDGWEYDIFYEILEHK